MRSVRFAPASGMVMIETDQPDIINTLIDGLEMKIEDAAKDGRYEDCRELCTVYLDLEKGLELIEIHKMNYLKKEEKQNERDCSSESGVQPGGDPEQPE